MKLFNFTEMRLRPNVDYRAGHVGFLDTDHRAEEFPYWDSVESAKLWLGSRYLCHQPINRRSK